jgi:hypothetical protein
VVGMGTGALRLLLLAILSLGVIGMHTVGHSTDHHGWDALSEGASSHAVSGVMGKDGPSLTGGADSCDGNCGIATAPVMANRSGSDPARDSAGVVVMCLAVLFGLSVLALIAGAVASLHRPVPGAASASWARFRRAGPVLSGFALRLVDVAVLRT